MRVGKNSPVVKERVLEVLAELADIYDKREVDDSNNSAYTGSVETAAFCAAAEEEGFSVAEFRRIIDNAKTAAKGEVTKRRKTARANEPPRPVPDAAKVKAAAQVLVAARKTKPSGRPRHILDPRLPEKAPEIFHDRKRREELGGKKENIVQFVQRVYEPWLDILTRADLRLLDETSDKAVENWISAGKKLPQDLLLTEGEIPRAKRAAKVRGAPKLREGMPVPE